MNEFDPAWGDQPRSPSPSLVGKTILVTRARSQSEGITTKLEALGATVIHCPTIEFVPPQSWAQFDVAAARIDQYDWIVFASANAVYFFFQRIRELGRDAVAILAKRGFCAIGPATALAIEAAGAVASIVAGDSRAEGALTAIIDHLGGPDQIQGLSFLIPRARIAREILPTGLRSLGAHVDTIETYQTIKPNIERTEVIRIFEENSIDAITFTSSSTVSNFAELTGLTDLSDLLATTLVACIGPTTAETAARYGLIRLIQPEQYNASALVSAIVGSIGEKSPGPHAG